MNQSEINSFITCPPNTATNNYLDLEASWNFEQINGTTVIDLSGNGINGTLTNSQSNSTNVPVKNCQTSW